MSQRYSMASTLKLLPIARTLRDFFSAVSPPWLVPLVEELDVPEVSELVDSEEVLAVVFCGLVWLQAQRIITSARRSAMRDVNFFMLSSFLLFPSVTKVTSMEIMNRYYQYTSIFLFCQQRGFVSLKNILFTNKKIFDIIRPY